jgi:peptidyl-prolyl cis-trans isomerase SurA
MKKKLFIALMLVAAIFAFQKAYCAVLLDRVVATVNDEVITWSELMNLIVFEEKEFLSGVAGTERKEKIRELERPYLNNLIEMKLQIQDAQKMRLEVNDSEIDGAINEIKNKFGLTDEALMNSLEAEGLTITDYRKRLADQILLQKVVNIAVRNNIVISDKEIEKYYEDNRGKYHAGEKLKIRQIFFALPEDASQKGIIEGKAHDLVQRINKGEDFANLASEFSEDASREFGGDLGYISRGIVLKEIEDTAFDLHKGEISEPFWSSAGLHIIKLEDRIEGGGLDEVRDKIKEVLFQRAFESKYRQWRTGLREKAYVEIKL